MARDMKAFRQDALDQIFGRIPNKAPSKQISKTPSKKTKDKSKSKSKSKKETGYLAEPSLEKGAAREKEAKAVINTLKGNADKNDVVIKTPGNFEIMSLDKAFTNFRQHLPKDIDTAHKMKMYLKDDDLSNGNVSIIGVGKLNERHYEPKSESSFKFPKTPKRSPKKAKPIAPLQKAYDADKDDEIKKARSKVIHDIVEGAEKRPQGKNYMLIEKNGKMSYKQPNELLAETGISKKGFASAFTSSPIKNTKNGHLIISVPKVKGGAPALEQALDEYLDYDITNSDSDISDAHIQKLQNESSPDKSASSLSSNANTSTPDGPPPRSKKFTGIGIGFGNLLDAAGDEEEQEEEDDIVNNFTSVL